MASTSFNLSNFSPFWKQRVDIKGNMKSWMRTENKDMFGTNLKPPPSTKLSFWHILNSVFQFFSFDHSISLDYPNIIDHHGSYKWTSPFHWRTFILRAVLQYLKIPTSRGIILSSCGKPEIKPIRSMRTRVDNPRSTGKLIQSTIPWELWERRCEMKISEFHLLQKKGLFPRDFYWSSRFIDPFPVWLEDT